MPDDRPDEPRPIPDRSRRRSPRRRPDPAQQPAAWPPPPQAPTSRAAPPPEVGPAPGIRFASHGPRLIAYIIDTLIISVVLIVVITVLSIVVFGSAWLSGLTSADFRGTPSPAAVGTVVGFVFLVLFFAVPRSYFPFFWARSGQTPGMRLLRPARRS